MNLENIVHDQIENFQDECFPELIDLDIESEGINLLSLFLKAGGNGKHPTVILLHGIPGYDDPIDIGHSLRRCGVNVIRPHYRGSWGVDGDYSIEHCIQDIKCTIDYITNYDNAEKMNIDTNNIFLVGISLGGFLALTHSVDKRIKATFAISPYDIGHVGTACKENQQIKEKTFLLFESLTKILRGIDKYKLMDEVILNEKEWNLINKSEQLSEQKIVIVTAERDTIAEKGFHQEPLIYEISKYNKENINKLQADTDHCYGNKRVWLAENILKFIK